MVDAETNQMIQEFATNLSQQGMAIDQYMQMTGMTPAVLKTQMTPQAEARIKTRLALEAVVEAEGIKVSDKDIDKELEEMANMYQMELDKVKEALGDAGREQVAKDVANKKAVEFIVKNAVEVEKADEEAEKEDK